MYPNIPYKLTSALKKKSFTLWWFLHYNWDKYHIYKNNY